MPQMATNELTASPIDRQNILNNSYALLEIAQATQVKGIEFEGAVWFTKNQLAQFFEVELRTIERYLENNQAELKRNGYVVLRGERFETLAFGSCFELWRRHSCRYQSCSTRRV